ncbi:MAG: hypothetical protein WC613_03820, partial [Candidatus Aenigmatarchaeota archaeon]
KKFMHTVKIDKAGNVIALSSSSKPDLLITAHMDEIGLMVKHISDDGFIDFERVGGILDIYLPFQRVVIHGTKDVKGIIAWKIDPSMTREKLKETPVKCSDLYIDTGLEKKELIALEILPGTIISYDQQTQEQGDAILGKAFDDRVGCFVALEIAKRLVAHMSFAVVFTVQEEIGLKGIQTALHDIDPKMAIEFEITTTSDIPNLFGKPIPIALGKGPVLTIADGAEGLTRGFTADRRLVKKIQKMSPELQYRIVAGGTSDASMTQVSKAGVPCISLCVPMRYAHTPMGIVKKKDILETIDFAERILLSFINDGTIENI